jgi:hypothetical protein
MFTAELAEPAEKILLNDWPHIVFTSGRPRDCCFGVFCGFGG